MSLFASVSFLFCFCADVEEIASSFSCALFFSRSYISYLSSCFPPLRPPSVFPASLSFLLHSAPTLFLFCAACASAPAVQAPPPLAYARRLPRRRAIVRTSSVCLRCRRVPCVFVGALLLASCVRRSPCAVCWSPPPPLWQSLPRGFLFASGGPETVSSLPSPSSPWSPTAGSSVIAVMCP